jgi:hypothetical protein
MAAPRTTKAVEIAKPAATAMPYEDAILDVSKRIADQELQVARKRSGQRACFVVLTLGNLVLAGIAAAAAEIAAEGGAGRRLATFILLGPPPSTGQEPLELMLARYGLSSRT